MIMSGCKGGPHIDDDPQWDSSIFHSGNLPPNTLAIDDMDLGCKPLKPVDAPTPSLEGYWDRDDTNGYLYPKQLNDEVLINYTAPFYDEQFGVTGKIYTTAGIMFGSGDSLISYAASEYTIRSAGRDALKITSGLVRGTQANAPQLNTLSATNVPGSPPFTFYGDADTGMYRHEDNGLAFSGGGVNKLVLNANGSIQIVTVPATAADENVPVLARNAATGIIEQRVLAELHTHANIAVLNLLTAPAGSLWYNGVLVFDASVYYTKTEVDALDAILLTNINTRSLNTHNHNLADLTEHSYNSLTDQPDLTSLHSHTNKATLDMIPDYAPASEGDVMIRSGGGIAWNQIGKIGVPRSLVNGTFVETFDARVTSNGTIVTMSLERSGGAGGDLTMQFSDGNFLLDCTPAATIELTTGSDIAPEENYIYILQSTKALTKSTSQWPATEHIKVAYFFVSSATYVAVEGPLINQNWNDHLSGVNNMGHLTHLSERARRDTAHYFSGVDGAGTDDYTTSTSGSVTVQCTSGVIYQIHQQTFAAKDTSGTDDVHIVNHNVTPYLAIQNLYGVVNDAGGNTLTNKFFNIVLWGTINKSGEYSPLLVNLPTGSYNTLGNAQSDINKYDVFSMPREFFLDSSTGFLIARLTFRKEGTSWTYHSTVDLRGQTPLTAGGAAGAAITSFSDNQFEIYNVTDNTKIINFAVGGLTTATTRTITMPDVDLTLIDYNGTVAKVDQIEELTTDAGILLGQCVTVDQLNARVGIGVPVPLHDLDVAGSGRFSDPTAGQSIIGYGLIINNNASSLAIGDFQVKTATYNAIVADASEDSILIMSNALGKIGFFGEGPTVQSTGWAITNHVLDKVLDADATTIDEICDVLGELITELKTKGILGG